jgi:glucan endo-1,3-alpha-glucosidase
MAVTRFWALIALLLCFHSISIDASDKHDVIRRTRSRAHVVFPQRDNSNTSVSIKSRTLVERAAPSGWSLYVGGGNDGGGCYLDSDSRIFTGYKGNDANNGLQSCLNACQSKGFKYGGVEYGSECYVGPLRKHQVHQLTRKCGDALPSNLASAASSQCNVACKTTTTDKCGGSWRMNVYTYTAPAPTTDLGTYTSKGCFSDSQTRILTGYSYGDSQLTIKKCLVTCKAKGFSMAGVE